MRATALMLYIGRLPGPSMPAILAVSAQSLFGAGRRVQQLLFTTSSIDVVLPAQMPICWDGHRASAGPRTTRQPLLRAAAADHLHWPAGPLHKLDSCCRAPVKSRQG